MQREREMKKPLPARRNTMGFTSDSFAMERWSSPKEILQVHRLMELAAQVGGAGMLDVKRIVDTIRKAKPKIYFSLEMITRDPLLVPCFTDKYWVTCPERSGKFLARAVAAARAHPHKPLPRITGLTPEARARLELDFIDRSIRYAATQLGLGLKA